MKLQELELINELTAFRGLPDHYSLRIDISVGTFSIIPGENKTRARSHNIR